MALHIVESNRVRVLLAELDRRLGPFDLFKKRSVLVPGRHFFSVVKNSLAATRGACFQVEVLTFDAWLARQARTRFPGVTPLDPEVLAAACFQELAFSERILEPGFEGLRTYLLQGSGTLRTDVAWQVSRELGALFCRYHQERPALTAAWVSGKTLTEAPMEMWQQRLFTAVLEGARATGEHDFASDLLRARLRPEDLAPALHVLAPNPWPQRDREFLHWLSTGSEVHLYLFSPCQEFFEQVRRTRRTAAGEEGLDANFPLLDAWGAPLAEPVTFCHELAGYQTETTFADPGKESNLARVQQAILENREGVTLEEPDDSLRVWRFASRREECVALRDDIACRLREDPRLRLCDFAIVVPETDAGPSALEELVSVFSEEPAVPLHRVRWRSDSESRVLQTVELLLGLPPEGGLATAVLELVCSPAIAVWNSEEEKLIRRWIVDSGAIRGWRDADLIGLDPDLKTHSWERALRRLALGAVAAPGVAMSLEVPGAGALGVRPLDFTAAQWPLLARLLTVVHGLRQFCEACARPRTVAGWMDFLGASISELVTARTERDQKLVGHCLEILGAHARRPIWSLRDPELTYAEVLPIVSAGITGLRTGHSPWSERGVWMGPIPDLGLLPFSHVYFAGLEDGAVAREIIASPLDVRSEPPARETELGRFLTALCHTEISVTCSWCDRNPSTGDPVASATIVRELIEAVDRTARILEQPPTAPVLLRSARVAAVADQLAKANLGPEILPAGTSDALRQFLKVPPPPEAREPATRIRRHFWKDFSRFLQFPLQVTARTWFFSRSDEPQLPPEEEPDQLVSWISGRWFEELLSRELRAGTDPAEPGLHQRLELDVRKCLHTAGAQAWGPAGVFAEALVGKLVRKLERTVQDALGEVAGALPDRGSWSGFSRSLPGLDPAVHPGASPPVRLPGVPCTVSGILPWFHPEEGILLLLSSSGSRARLPELVCDAWVALNLQVMIAAPLPVKARVVLVRPAIPGPPCCWEWPMPEPAGAREELTRLAAEMSNPENLVFLNQEMVLAWLSGGAAHFEPWYLRRAYTLANQWKGDHDKDWLMDPVWDLDPLIDAPRAQALARRLYLDPGAPVAQLFLNRIVPVLRRFSPDLLLPQDPQEDDDGDA